MKILSRLLILLLLSLCGLTAEAELQVSVITCWPGQEVYELYGHTALRIRGSERNETPFDSVWNYGVFSYNEPNFVGRFVKGEMMYQVAGYPFSYFMPGYVWSERRVEEQILNLTDAQAADLRHALQVNCLPQNRVYLYDYVRDNCSTRVWDRIDAAAEGIRIPDGQLYPTYREAMRAYHSHYPWYSLGIDLALGYPIDTAINNADQLFLPIALHDKLAAAKLPDGRPAVRSVQVLNTGLPDATLPPTPWYLSPLFWGWMLFALAIVYTAYCRRIRRMFNWPEALLFGIIGMAGCVVAYLVFFSIHRAASPNLLLTWINPLALLVPALIWSRRTRPIAVAYMIAQAIALIFTAIVWPFQTQCGNAAMLPVALTDLTLAIAYAVLYLQNRNR